MPNLLTQDNPTPQRGGNPSRLGRRDNRRLGRLSESPEYAAYYTTLLNDFWAEYENKQQKRQQRQPPQQVNLPPLFPQFAQLTPHALAGALTSKMPELFLRNLRDDPPRYDQETKAILSLPEPYRTAARLLPGNGWLFAHLACLHAVAQDEDRVPDQRERALGELLWRVSKLLRRPPGRPRANIALGTLIRIKEQYTLLLAAIKELRKQPEADPLQTLRPFIDAAVNAPADIPARLYTKALKQDEPVEGALSLLARAVGRSPKVLGEILFRKDVSRSNPLLHYEEPD